MTWIRFDAATVRHGAQQVRETATNLVDIAHEVSACCECAMPAPVATLANDGTAAVRAAVDAVAVELAGDAADLLGRASLVEHDDLTTAASAAWGSGTVAVGGSAPLTGYVGGGGYAPLTGTFAVGGSAPLTGYVGGSTPLTMTIVPGAAPLGTGTVSAPTSAFVGGPTSMWSAMSYFAAATQAQRNNVDAIFAALRAPGAGAGANADVMPLLVNPAMHNLSNAIHDMNVLASPTALPSNAFGTQTEYELHHGLYG
jgi:hypothetical protein